MGNKLNEAALLYIELLRSNICPNYFRLTLLMDVLMFIENSNECYFNIADMSLITMRLDDAITEWNEDNESDNQYLLSKVFNIRQENDHTRHLSITSFQRKLPNGEKCKRQWLMYCPSQGVVYCFMCKLFGSDHQKNQSPFVGTGF